MPHPPDGVRSLTNRRRDEFLALARRDPVVNVFVIARVESTPRWLGGEFWGRFEDGVLVAACLMGGVTVPVGATGVDARVFAELAVARGRTAATIVGPQEAVAAFRATVADAWGPPRDERWDQRHLVLDGAPRVEPDPRVRFAEPEDLDALYLACVSVHLEEVGVSPEAGRRPDAYRAKVARRIAHREFFVRDDGDGIVFKADVACATAECSQVEGVWVAPHRRGEGLAAAGMAAVCGLLREERAPTVSLYVNESNEPARRTYDRVGFVETARFATVMF